MKRALLVVTIIVCAVLLLFLMKQTELPITSRDVSSSPLLPPEPIGPTLSLGDRIISVEVARTDEEQALGLGGREAMEDDHGMLFVFSESDQYGIWMQDMLFPLDIVWLTPTTRKNAGMTRINAEGTQTLVVVDMKENVAVETYPEIFYPGAPALYVLELKGGFAQRNDIYVGSVLTLNE